MQDNLNYREAVLQRERYYKTMILDIGVELAKVLYARPEAKSRSLTPAEEALSIAEYMVTTAENIKLKNLAKAKVNEILKDNPPVNTCFEDNSFEGSPTGDKKH